MVLVETIRGAFEELRTGLGDAAARQVLRALGQDVGVANGPLSPSAVQELVGDIAVRWGGWMRELARGGQMPLGPPLGWFEMLAVPDGGGTFGIQIPADVEIDDWEFVPGTGDAGAAWITKAELAGIVFQEQTGNTALPPAGGPTFPEASRGYLRRLAAFQGMTVQFQAANNAGEALNIGVFFTAYRMTPERRAVWLSGKIPS